MDFDYKLVKSEGKFDRDFKERLLIGEGSYGFVYLVKHKTDNSLHAIKKIKFDSIYLYIFNHLANLRILIVLTLRS